MKDKLVGKFEFPEEYNLYIIKISFNTISQYDNAIDLLCEYYEDNKLEDQWTHRINESSNKKYKSISTKPQLVDIPVRTGDGKIAAHLTCYVVYDSSQCTIEDVESCISYKKPLTLSEKDKYFPLHSGGLPFDEIG